MKLSSMPQVSHSRKVIICGTRKRYDAALISDAVLASGFGFSGVVSGGAPGVDTAAIDWARGLDIAVTCFPADWQAHGKAAGPIRNQKMADYCQPGDYLIAIPCAESVGTWDMIKKAWLRGLKIYIHPK